MASSAYGRKLNPYRRLRDPLGVKGVRQSVVVTNNPSSIDQNQQLLVRFPNLGAHDVVVPGTARLAFTVSLTSTDANRTIVKNIGRAVVKKTTIKISGNEVLSIDDSDVLHCYQDLWKTAQERSNSQYQGIDLSDDSNVIRIRVGAGNKDETEAEDAAIAAAYGNRYHIPLDFELLESHMPFYQSALGDRLEYELTFNDYSRVVVATGDALLHWKYCVRVRHGDPARSRKTDQEPVCGPPGRLVWAGPTPQENHSQQKRHPMEHQLERPGAKHVGHSDVIRGTGGSLPAGHWGLLQP